MRKVRCAKLQNQKSGSLSKGLLRNSNLNSTSRFMGWCLFLFASVSLPYESQAANIFDRQGSCKKQYIGSGIHFCNENGVWRRTFAEDGAIFSFYLQATRDIEYRASIFIERTNFSREFNLDSAFDFLKEQLTRSLSESDGKLTELSRERLLDFGGSLLISYQIITKAGSIVATETMKLEDQKMIRLVTYRSSENRHPGDFQIHASFKKNINLSSR